MVDEFLNLFRLSGIQINFGEGHIGVPDVAAKLDGTLQDLLGHSLRGAFAVAGRG